MNTYDFDQLCSSAKHEHYILVYAALQLGAAILCLFWFGLIIACEVYIKVSWFKLPITNFLYNGQTSVNVALSVASTDTRRACQWQGWKDTKA